MKKLLSNLTYLSSQELACYSVGSCLSESEAVHRCALKIILNPCIHESCDHVYVPN